MNAEDLGCVIKTLRDKEENIVWQCLYKNGKKQLEDVSIDPNVAKKLFNDNKTCKIIEVTEDDFTLDEKDLFFPEIEDFTHYLDYKKIDVGDTVYLIDGEFKIESIEEDYRTAGYYDIVMWHEIDKKFYSTKHNTFYDGHSVITFKVEGKDEEFIWEDYNYQQSFLYLKSKQNGTI